MEGQPTLFQVRDRRIKERFTIDNLYLNGYAKHIGLIGTAIYVSLCRHADMNQEAWPSQDLLAKEHGITDRVIRNHTKKLEKLNIIHIERTRNHRGQLGKNRYILLDKSVWRPPEELRSAGFTRGTKRHLPEELRSAHKKTHIEKDPIRLSPKGEPAIAGKSSFFLKRNMRTYSENEFSDSGEGVVDIETGEIISKKHKENQNQKWNTFQRFFKSECYNAKGIEPEIVITKDKPIYHRIRKLYTPQQMAEIIQFFLQSPKSNEHLTISACFSADTINQWKLKSDKSLR